MQQFLANLSDSTTTIHGTAFNGISRTQRSHSNGQVTALPASIQKAEILPTSFLQYRTKDFIYDLRNNNCSTERWENGFKHQLINQWEVAITKNVFNYKLNCMYKLLDGQYELSLQLNVERGKLRRKPMRFQYIRQPFNHLRWNFMKLKPAELLYVLRCIDKPYTEDKFDMHALAINASPLEKAHSLIIPSLNKCLPQVLNSTSVRIAVDLMLIIEDENFHVLFNSLLGQASVNHLHLHILFWPYESDLINRKCEVLYPPDVYLIRRPEWFIQAFVFQLTSSTKFDAFISNLIKCAGFLTNQNIAHNLYMSRAPPIQYSNNSKNNNKDDFGSKPNKPLYVTAYLFPRRNITGAKPATNFNPAALELAGCLTAYTYNFFETATELAALRIIDEDAVLPDFIFEQLVNDLADRYEGRVSWQENSPIESPLKFLSASHPVGTFRSQSLSDNHQRGFKMLGLDENAEILSSNELDELVDEFHSIIAIQRK